MVAASFVWDRGNKDFELTRYRKITEAAGDRLSDDCC
jgi:hypothetical protein